MIKGYVQAHILIDWAKACLDITKPNSEMTDVDIRQVVRWVGLCSFDTMFVDGDQPIFRRVGIGMMLSVTLLEFPEFYTRYGLAQFN